MPVSDTEREDERDINERGRGGSEIEEVGDEQIESVCVGGGGRDSERDQRQKD